jgi:hypothetical protein
MVMQVPFAGGERTLAGTVIPPYSVADWLSRWATTALWLILSTSTVAGSGCDLPGTANCVCTATFVFLIVTVHDPAGLPVTGVSVTVTQVRTGQVLAVQQGAPTAGTYIFLDDSFVRQISASGETLRVTGQKGSASFSADYVVGADSCGCHVQKVSGPDIVTLQ